MTPGDAPQGATELTDDEAVERIQAMLTRDKSGDSDGEDEDAEPDKGEDTESEPEDAQADEGEDEEADDGETEQAEQQPQTIRVKVDDEELEVTLDELKRGYSREADYTRKTMALGDAKRAQESEIASQKEAVVKEREQYKAILDYWAQQINVQMGTPEELEKLRNSANPEDRQEYALRVADQVRFKEKLGNIEAEQRRLKDKESLEQSTAQKAHAAEEGKKLLQAVPEWKDPAKWEADGKRIYTYAATYGISGQELNQITDHRMMRVLHDAARYRELQTKKPEPVKKVATVRPVQPGSVQTQPGAPKSREAKLIDRTRRGGGKDADIAELLRLRLG